MEPVFMILGQSAATAAVYALEDELSVQDVPYKKLRDKLIEDGQILEFNVSDRLAFGIGVDTKNLSGVVVDGEALSFEGEWVESSSLRPFVGFSYFHDGNGGKGMRSACFPFNAPKDGLHEIMVSYVSSGNRAGQVRYEIQDEKGLSKIIVDQRKKANTDDLWHSLGSFVFEKGKKYDLRVFNEDTEGYVIVDAAHVIPLD
jgi:hypothetical protein